MLDTGDRIVVESPTYLAALQSWRTYGAQFVSVPSDIDGIVTTDLPAIFATNPKMVYCVPNFQNPRGVTISDGGGTGGDGVCLRPHHYRGRSVPPAAL